MHHILAEEFTRQIKEGTVVGVSEEGTEIRVSPGASLLQAARQFLKDNAIECDPDRPSAGIEGLTEALDDPHFHPDMPDFKN